MVVSSRLPTLTCVLPLKHNLCFGCLMEISDELRCLNYYQDLNQTKPRLDPDAIVPLNVMAYFATEHRNARESEYKFRYRCHYLLRTSQAGYMPFAMRL